MAIKRQQTEIDRRGFLSMLVAGAATLSVGGPSALAPANGALSALDELPAAHLPGKLETVFPYFRPGVTVVNGWEISRAGWNHGAVELECTRGSGEESFVVAICKRSNPVQGIEVTDQFELFLMNDGEGRRATEKDAHQALRIVAEVTQMGEPTLEQLALFSPHAERLVAIENGTLQYATAG